MFWRNSLASSVDLPRTDFDELFGLFYVKKKYSCISGRICTTSHAISGQLSRVLKYPRRLKQVLKNFPGKFRSTFVLSSKELSRKVVLCKVRGEVSRQILKYLPDFLVQLWRTSYKRSGSTSWSSTEDLFSRDQRNISLMCSEKFFVKLCRS